jgi:hypothetical protein
MLQDAAIRPPERNAPWRRHRHGLAYSRRHRPRPIGGRRRGDRAQPEARRDWRRALLSVLLEGATIIALVFALLFKLIK